MPTIYTFLSEIRQRPGMYVGGDEHDRGGQLRRLQFLLFGYGSAVELHGIDEPGRGFVVAFNDYLRERFGWSTSLGPMVAIIDNTPTPADAWSRFWELIDEFQCDSSSEER